MDRLIVACDSVVAPVHIVPVTYMHVYSRTHAFANSVQDTKIIVTLDYG